MIVQPFDFFKYVFFSSVVTTTPMLHFPTTRILSYILTNFAAQYSFYTNSSPSLKQTTDHGETLFETPQHQLKTQQQTPTQENNPYLTSSASDEKDEESNLSPTPLRA